MRMETAASVALLATVAGIVLRGAWKGVDCYGTFLEGAKQGAQAGAALLPALCAMTLLLRLMDLSGVNALLTRLLAPALQWLGLPEEVAPLMALRPLSGSASLTALEQIFTRCGTDSRAGRIASVLMGSSETIFYTLTVYLAAARVKRLPGLIPVSLLSYLAGAAVAGAVL